MLDGVAGLMCGPLSLLLLLLFFRWMPQSPLTCFVSVKYLKTFACRNFHLCKVLCIAGLPLTPQGIIRDKKNQ